MESADALAMFRAIPLPVRRDVLHVRPLVSNAFLAVDHAGRLHLYFELKSGCMREYLRSMKALEFSTSNNIEIIEEGDKRRKTSGFLVALIDGNKTWRFATIACEVAWILSNSPNEFSSESAIDDFILDWAELFANQKISLKRAVGLWGELFTISSFHDRCRGIACWTGPLGEPFDFTGNAVRIEVKTSVGSSRAWFKLEQLQGTEGAFSWFLRVSYDAVNGYTLDDMVESIRASLLNRNRFEALIARAGYEPGMYPELRLAIEETLMFPNSVLPTPTCEDRRITAVRFRLNVDQLRDMAVSNTDVLERIANSV